MKDETGWDVEKNNILLRFYFRIDPDVLTDDEYAKEVNRLWWVLKFTGQFDEKGTPNNLKSNINIG